MALPEGFAPIDFAEYHRRTLPDLLASGRAALIGADARRLPRLALRVGDGASVTYAGNERGVAITDGDADAETVLEIGVEDWCGLVHELDAPAGLVYGGRVRSVRGNAADLMRWETTLRALYNGRPRYRPEALDLRDRHGAPLDPERAFAPGDDRDDMAHFLGTAGYLFVRGVFSPGDAARMMDEAIALRAEARPGDRLSWWGRNAAGEDVLTRVTRANVKHHLGGLPADSRLLSLVALAETPASPRTVLGFAAVVAISATVFDCTVEIATAAPKPALPP